MSVIRVLETCSRAASIVRGVYSSDSHEDWRSLIRITSIYGTVVAELVLVDEILSALEEASEVDEVRACALLERAYLHANRALEKASYFQKMTK